MLRILSKISTRLSGKPEVEKPVRVVWGPCCFCGEQIAETEVDPCSVQVTTASGNWQMWYCHAECFKVRLATNDVMDLSPAHF